MRVAASLLVACVLLTAAAAVSRAGTGGSPAPQAAPQAARPTLDYAFFRDRVEPVFVKKRPGHARCIACHGSGTPMRLQALPHGATTWSEDDSRKNFDIVRRFVVPGSVKSRLLTHPLEEAAGGDFYHNGGKHFTTQDDPEWQTLKAWVMGQTAQ